MVRNALNFMVVLLTSLEHRCSVLSVCAVAVENISSTIGAMLMQCNSNVTQSVSLIVSTQLHMFYIFSADER